MKFLVYKTSDVFKDKGFIKEFNNLEEFLEWVREVCYNEYAEGVIVIPREESFELEIYDDYRE